MQTISPKTRNKRIRKALGITTPDRKIDRLVSAMDYRTQQATQAIDRGADPKTAWNTATAAASKVYGLHAPDLWKASRFRQAVREGMYRPDIAPPPLVAPAKRPEPLGPCEDDPAPPDPRFPRRAK